MSLDGDQMRRDLEAMIGDRALRAPFDRALELCVELSDPGSRANWIETLGDAQGFADRGLVASDEEIRFQSSSFLGLLLLSQLGEVPQEALLREVQRRVETVREVRNEPDARAIASDDVADGLVHTLKVAMRVAQAFNPAEGSKA